MRYVVFTSGHSGRTWLSLLLHQPDMGTLAFHEPLSNMLGPLLAQSQLWSDRATFLARSAA